MNDVSTREIETAEPAGYPTSWEFDGLLADGQAVLVRPVKPGDAKALVGLHVHPQPGAPPRIYATHPSLMASEMSISRRWITENAWRSWYWQRTVWSRSRVLIA